MYIKNTNSSARHSTGQNATSIQWYKEQKQAAMLSSSLWGILDPPLMSCELRAANQSRANKTAVIVLCDVAVRPMGVPLLGLVNILLVLMLREGHSCGSSG